MDPMSMTLASIGMSAAGGLMGAGGAMAEGEANAEMYGFKAGLARRNAEIAKENADYTRWSGEYDRMRYGMKAGAERSAIRTQRAASGFDVNTGSNADIEASHVMVSDMDMAMIHNNAARKAYGYEMQAEQELAQANIYDRAGRNAKTAAKYKAASTLIAGASSVSNKWLDGSRTGIF